MNKVEKKRQKEQYVVEEMIRLYCRKNHGKEGHASGGMCPECQKLADYAKRGARNVPSWNRKHSAQTAKYTATSRKCGKRSAPLCGFRGPRMLLYHPILAIWHLICSMREKRKAKA